MKNNIDIRQKQKEVLDSIRKRSVSIAHSKHAIALLLDVSGSMYGMKIEDAKEALIHFLVSISLVENEVGLVAFGDIITTSEMSQNLNYLETKIKNFEASGETPMMRAIKVTYEKLLEKKASPVMVIATDGQPTDTSEEDILEYANPINKRGVWIITIGIGKDVNKDFLKKLASSPADYHFAKASFELKNIYKEVANVLALPEKRTDYLK